MATEKSVAAHLGDGLRCPICHSAYHRVLDTDQITINIHGKTSGFTRRRRVCGHCKHVFMTREHVEPPQMRPSEASEILPLPSPKESLNGLELKNPFLE